MALAFLTFHIQLRVKAFTQIRSEVNMKLNMMRIAWGLMIGVALSTAAFGQYAGGVTGTTGGGGATAGGYTPPKGGYSSSTGIAIGAGAAAAAAVGYFALRSRHSVVGCVGESAKGNTLTAGKMTYALDNGDVNLKVGERVKLRGKKMKSGAGERTFAVKKLVKDYGSCTTMASLSQR
jgi:hypothetical protein